MTDRCTLVLAILFAATPGLLTAAETPRPVPVSPGHASRLVSIGDRCPTFSWGQVAGTDRYELVVYRVGIDEEEAPEALRARIHGRAGSWTPTLGGCLERGGRYAWSIRAWHDGAASEWSAAALFEVIPAPGPEELDEALALVRGYAAAGLSTEQGARSKEAPTARTQPDEASETEAYDDPAGDRTPERGSAPAAFSVDGGVEAASFSGDGSDLVNVEAAALACVDCVAVGHLQDGSVTAAKIGVGCASGQVLMKTPSGWECATLTAPACTPGDEVSCYTGPTGTRGIGECLAGGRVCLSDSTWGSCSGEITPAAVEICDGLDNTCDGPIDEGDPSALCPPTANVTATLCDTAVCAVTTCEPLWADADGEYANGCEAPAPGFCLEAGAPRPIVPPAEGELVIQEILANPASPLSDADAEWFEVAVEANVDINGLGIGTAFGTVIDQIDTADCLPVVDGDLLLFARTADPATNGGLGPDQTFSFSLVNGGGDLHLAHDGNLLDAISWSAGDVTAGQARNLPAAFQNATANDDQANWCNVGTDAGLLYSTGNYGTPGLENVACP